MMDLELLGFLTRVQANPNAFASAIFVWPVALAWVLFGVRSGIDGELDPPVAFGLIFAGIGLGHFVTTAANPTLSVIVFGAMVLLTIAFPVVRIVQGATEHSQLNVDLLENAYDHLGRNPTNPVMQFKVAECAYACNLKGHAVALADKALAGRAKDQFRWEIAAITKWKESGIHPRYFAEIACRNCGQMVGLGGAFCPGCGAPYLALAARGAFNPNLKLNRWVTTWLAGVVVVLLIPITASAALPVPVVVGLVVLEIAAGVYFLMRAFRLGGESK